MNQEAANDEINLAEIFSKLWAYKFLFIPIIFICVACTTFYISNAEKLYTSKSTFIPHKNNQDNGSNLSLGNTGALSLAALSGFPVFMKKMRY